MYRQKIENLKSEVEQLLMKNGCINFHTQIGSFAKTLEWIDRGNFHSIYMMAAIREQFLVIFFKLI
jgi:hypothetical protein